jgi:hypothetical protein
MNHNQNQPLKGYPVKEIYIALPVSAFQARNDPVGAAASPEIYRVNLTHYRIVALY